MQSELNYKIVNIANTNRWYHFSIVRLSILMPFLILLHTIEELLFMKERLEHNPEIFFVPVTYESFIITTTIVSIIGFSLMILPSLRKKITKIKLLIIHMIITSIFFLNSIIHIVTFMINLQYDAGIITGAFLLIPYSIYMELRIKKEHLLKKKELVIGMILSIIILILVLIFSLEIGIIISNQIS